MERTMYVVPFITVEASYIKHSSIIYCTNPTGKRYTPQKGPKYGLLCVYSSLLITNTLIAFDLTSFESKRSFAM
jgi:hypothetical protein